MSDNLTVEELNRVVNSISKGSSITGFKINPADYKQITEQTKYMEVKHIETTCYLLPYYSVPLYCDTSIPRGFCEPIRR